MYSQEDMQSIRQMIRKRWLVTILPAAALFAVAIAVFVYGQLNRSDTLWMVTVALTLAAGFWFLFLFGVYMRPARVYAKHLHYMLEGRMRETTGVFKSFSEDVSDRDGLQCYAMLLNVGEKDDPEDDRLFYYDIYKERPAVPFGTRVIVRSNDKMVASIQPL